jgi:pyruvate dehydrogenase E2 component (dihydrolipoamide acetyltransferase)
MNSTLTDKGIVLQEEINIGIAVALDNGLIVPNIKNAHTKSIIEISDETKRLAELARSVKLKPDQYKGGTFTITNLGMMGIENFSPIINQPEVAILGVNKIINTPVVLDGEIVVKPMMNLNFVADHRVIDGAYAAKYISRVKELLETLEA